MKNKTIKKKGQKLFVQAQTMESANSDELQREFKREFNLPKDVEPNSIKAHLDEKTRELKLTGLLSTNYTKHSNAYSDERDTQHLKIGAIKEIITANTIDYEVYLGDQLKDGQIIFEVPNAITLNVRVIKTESDDQGSFNLELKREIKLPPAENKLEF